MPFSTESESRFEDDQEFDLASVAVGSLRALQKQRILQWCIRSAITGTLLWWLSTKYEWVRVLFYIWAVIAVLSLLALLLLPTIVGSRIRAMEQTLTEGLDAGGAMGFGGLASSAETPRDIDVDGVRTEESDQPRLPSPSVPEFAPVPLEEQLDELARLGVRMNKGVTVDDLCHSCDRSHFESQPYDALLFLLGSDVERAPWGRHVSDCAWLFDANSIDGDGSYVDIVAHLARIAGKEDRVDRLDDSFDLDRGKAEITYALDGQVRSYHARVRYDWADPATLQAIVDDFADEAIGFYGIERGQSILIYCLRREHGPGFQALVPQDVVEIA